MFPVETAKKSVDAAVESVCTSLGTNREKIRPDDDGPTTLSIVTNFYIPTISPWCSLKDMGNVEMEARKRRRRRNIEHAVLAAVGVAGILSVAMIAPNIFQAIPRIAGDKYRLKYRAQTVAGRLAQKGLARFVIRNNVQCVELTEKGLRKFSIANNEKRPRSGYTKKTYTECDLQMDECLENYECP